MQSEKCRDLAMPADEYRKERTTRRENKPAFTGDDPRATPISPDRVDPILPFRPDSVCPPGCFWICLDQDKSCGLFLPVDCPSGFAHNLCCLTKHIWNKAWQS